DIPGYSVTFSLDGEAECLLYMSLWAYAYSTGDYPMGQYRMVLDDTPLWETQRLFGFSAARVGSSLWCTGDVTALTKRVLSSGQHTLKGQFAATSDTTVSAFTRTI